MALDESGLTNFRNVTSRIPIAIGRILKNLNGFNKFSLSKIWLITAYYFCIAKVHSIIVSNLLFNSSTVMDVVISYCQFMLVDSFLQILGS